MKQLIAVAALAMTTGLLACNSSSDNKSTTDTHMMSGDDTTMHMHDMNGSDEGMKTMTAMYSSMDAGATQFSNSLVADYLSIKNALVKSDAAAVASAAKEMKTAVSKFDQSLLTVEQKKSYDEVEAGISKDLDALGETDLKAQRDQFVSLSKHMYDFVKYFGTDKALYKDHCPMYNNGSMWLSESKDIQNPYYGDKMMTCGSMQEMFSAR